MDSSQVQEFERNGFLIISNFLTKEEVEDLKLECKNIINAMDPKEATVFQSGKNQVGDDYFLSSGDKIRFFLEKDAINENDELAVDREKSLNKIGHALHWFSHPFRKVTFSAKVKELVSSLNFKDPLIAQSMYIFKHPDIGSEVVPHQDSTYLYTDPPKLLGLWFPLVDCTPENGCLWFLPGSHKGEIYQRLIRSHGDETRKLILNGNMPKFEDSKFIPALAAEGSCVVIHGQVIHKSGRNLSDNSRPAYTFHVVDNETTYSSDNWLQPSKELPFPHLFGTE